MNIVRINQKAACIQPGGDHGGTSKDNLRPRGPFKALMSDGETGPQPRRLGEQDVLPSAGGLQPKDEELSVQGRRPGKETDDGQG